LKPEDHLFFMGKPETVIAMVTNEIGLELPNYDKNKEVVEAVIPANSSLDGKCVDQDAFASNYGAEVVAIHRNGAQLGNGLLDGLELSHGDFLLLSVEDAFFKNTSAKKDFYVLSKLDKKVLPSSKRINTFLIGLVLILLGIFSGFLPLFLGLLLVLTLLLFLELYTIRDINAALDIDLIIMLASALTIGNTLVETGAASGIVSSFIHLLSPYGNVAILTGLFIVTVLLTSFITNVAAASIIFPFALELTRQFDASLQNPAFFVGLAFAASAAFITPVSYQTNWMVYGPGGYSNKDFSRVGLPLAAIYAVVCITFISIRYGL
ncbi:MAG: SLC13 family permease, partial [Bacteroidota bacterium]